MDTYASSLLILTVVKCPHVGALSSSTYLEVELLAFMVCAFSVLLERASVFKFRSSIHAISTSK